MMQISVKLYMVITENILNILHVRKHYFVVMRRTASSLSKEISVIGFFQLTNSSLQQQKKQPRRV